MAYVWDIQPGEASPLLLQHGAMVHSAEFSPDGAQVIVASHDATARVLLARVVAQDREHGDVGLGRDALAHGRHRPRASLPCERVEERRVGGLQRRAAVELRDRVVGQAVEADVQEPVHLITGT
jgi:hypothetical protein